MNLTVIVPLLTVALSAWISYMITKGQKKLEFSYNYRKLILDKRVNAYAQLERIIPLLREKNGPLLGEEPNEYYPDGIDEVINALNSLKKNFGFWISPEIDEHLFWIQADYAVMHSNKEEFIRLSIDKRYNTWARIFKRVVALEECYFHDIMNLDNIEAFKKEKAPPQGPP